MQLITETKEWEGIEDAEERRRTQNRLNQRAARQRKLAAEKSNGIVRRARGRPKGTIKKTTPSTSTSPESVDLALALSQPLRVCQVDATTVSRFVDQLVESFTNGLRNGDPTSDLLLSLTQFNAFRAMLQNMNTLGLTMEMMKEDNRISSFNQSLPVGQLPASLQPTAVQSTIPHHPWIDPFPIPSFRDALLINEGKYDEDDLCNDLVGQCGLLGGQVGIIVWGEAWDPMGFEMTEAFAKKWADVFQDCWEIRASTDYWRRSRGERPIFEVDDEVVDEE